MRTPFCRLTVAIVSTVLVSTSLLINPLTLSPAHASLQDGTAYAVELDQAGFKIDGEYKILRGGSLQWFRLPEATWRDRLKRFKAAGFSTIDLYIPWNVIEPKEGEFNFTQPNLATFLTHCAELGLYVYFRPGPYITNELDGGGVPAWLMANSTKKSTAADGRPNLRTDDPDFLFYVKRYFNKLNEHIKPFLATNGGPIILYSIENEYSWFELLFQLDKLSWYEGAIERPLNAPLPTKNYLSALRDMVRKDGITIPITTCPGNGMVSGMADVEEVVPMPNMYSGLGGDLPEKTAWSLLQDMHDPSKHNGAYVNYPSGTTETDRIPSKIKRLIMGGLDATFAFNVVGTFQEGFRNAVVINNGSIMKLLEPGGGSLLDKVLNVEVSYFHNVIDFNGPISPSGGHRESFYEFRRDNLFFDTIERYLAPVTHTLRSGSGFNGSDTRLKIQNPELGAREEKARIHYWADAGNDVNFINVVNESSSAQTIGINGITLKELSFPRYTPATIPLQVFDGEGQFSAANLSYAVILVTGLPINQFGTMTYTTSELMSSQQFNDEQLLIVHGRSGTKGEMKLANIAGLEVLHADAGITVHEKTASHTVISYDHATTKQLLLKNAKGQKLRLFITNSTTAGRTWIVKGSTEDIIISGIDFIDEDKTTHNLNSALFYAEHAGSRDDITIVTPKPFTTNNNLSIKVAYNSTTHTTVLQQNKSLALNPLPSLYTGAKAKSDTAESNTEYNDSQWRTWQGDPTALERNDILTGHAWYRSEFTIKKLPAADEPTPLYVKSASDIVGVYVNGHYVSTVAPMGTKINSDSHNEKYRFASMTPYLNEGKNTIAFRTEIWGHGSFMFPRGPLLFFGPAIPAVGFDSIKGLQGYSKLGKYRLNNWKLQAQLGGQRAGYQTATFDDRQWASGENFSMLEKGDIRWFRTTFDSADLPNPSTVEAPVVLSLTGLDSKATIYVNGRLIGRWISNPQWLEQGFWAKSIRDMWMSTNPNHFPVPIDTLNPPGQPNHVAIVFEDTSHSSKPTGGKIDSISLEYAVENKRFENGKEVRQNAAKVKLPVELNWN